MSRWSNLRLKYGQRKRLNFCNKLDVYVANKTRMTIWRFSEMTVPNWLGFETFCGFRKTRKCRFTPQFCKKNGKKCIAASMLRSKNFEMRLCFIEMHQKQRFQQCISMWTRLGHLSIIQSAKYGTFLQGVEFPLRYFSNLSCDSDFDDWCLLKIPYY